MGGTLSIHYIVTSRDVNFRYTDRMSQTRFVHGEAILLPFLPEFSAEFSAPQ